MARRHHRPMMRDESYFDQLPKGIDPALLREAGDLVARMLVRGTQGGDDALADRMVTLAETEGLETLAQVWAGAPPESLAGALWRLYLLRSWVHSAPNRAAAEFEAGRGTAQVAGVVAGVADPPGPDQLKAMIDEVLRGIVDGDFCDVLHRASAFAHVVAVGRAILAEPQSDGDEQSTQILQLAEQLEVAAGLEMRAALG